MNAQLLLLIAYVKQVCTGVLWSQYTNWEWLGFIRIPLSNISCRGRFDGIFMLKYCNLQSAFYCKRIIHMIILKMVIQLMIHWEICQKVQIKYFISQLVDGQLAAMFKSLQVVEMKIFRHEISRQFLTLRCRY